MLVCGGRCWFLVVVVVRCCGACYCFVVGDLFVLFGYVPCCGRVVVVVGCRARAGVGLGVGLG